MVWWNKQGVGGAPGYGVGEEQRNLEPRLWELSESSSEKFLCWCDFFFLIATIHFTIPLPFPLSGPQTQRFSFGENSPRAVESVHCGGGEQDFGFMVGYFLNLT